MATRPTTPGTTATGTAAHSRQRPTTNRRVGAGGLANIRRGPLGRPRGPWAALLVVLAVLAGVGACGTDGGPVSADSTGSPEVTTPSTATDVATPALPVTVTDAVGRDVSVDDVSRIVPLAGSVTEVVYDLGLGDRVVGRDVSATLAEAAELPVVTNGHDVSAESVLSLRPTLVLADEETGPPEAIDHLRNVGVPVVTFERATSIEQIPDRITAIAAALGVPDAGEELVADVAAELADVEATVPGGPAPRVAFLYLRGNAGVYLLGGPDSGSDSMIEHAGGVDAGTSMGLTDAFTPITSEAMVQAAPDALLLTTTGLDSVGGLDGLAAIPGVAQTPAGRDRRVVAVEDGLLFGFGSRTPDALAQIIEQLYP